MAETVTEQGKAPNRWSKCVPSHMQLSSGNSGKFRGRRRN